MQTLDQRRRQLLTTALRVCVKLGALYADPAVGNTATARERLEWAVHTLLEQHHADAPRHRHRHRTSDADADTDAGAGAGADAGTDADEWLLPRTEAGALFESFGTLLESLSLHHLAAPLFVQALLLLGNSSSSRGRSSSSNDINANTSSSSSSSSSWDSSPALASRTAASTVSKLRRASPGMLYLNEMTSPCSVIRMLPPTVPDGWASIAS
jgi:hypothetical protein